jgi:hypothetical protein
VQGLHHYPQITVIEKGPRPPMVESLRGTYWLPYKVEGVPTEENLRPFREDLAAEGGLGAAACAAEAAPVTAAGAASSTPPSGADRVQRLYLNALKKTLTGYALKTPSWKPGVGKGLEAGAAAGGKSESAEGGSAVKLLA